MRRIDEEHGKMASFNLYSIPQAQIKLKQGFGRLIRTQTDRGIVCILDTRIITKNYGEQFVKSLPPARRASKFAGLEKFWKTIPCGECGDPFMPNDALTNGVCAACAAPAAVVPFD
jgi:ATP-dependent DNA helicase DinG